MKKIVITLSLMLMISLSTFAYVDFEKTISESGYWGWGDTYISGTLYETPDGDLNFKLTCTNDGNGTTSRAQVEMDYGYIYTLQQDGDGTKTRSGMMDNDDSAVVFALYVQKTFWGMNRRIKIKLIIVNNLLLGLYNFY